MEQRSSIQVEVLGAPLRMDEFLIGQREYYQFTDDHTIHIHTRVRGPISISLVDSSPSLETCAIYIILNLSECYDIPTLINHVCRIREHPKCKRIVVIANAHNTIHILASGVHAVHDIRVTPLDVILGVLFNDELLPLKSSSIQRGNTVVITLYRGDATTELIRLLRHILQRYIGVRIEMQRPCSPATATILSGEEQGDRSHACEFIKRVVQYHSLILHVSYV